MHDSNSTVVAANRYIEETIQKTGVAMETSTFSFVTSGKKRDTLTGKATLQLFPHFKELAECAGMDPLQERP